MSVKQLIRLKTEEEVEKFNFQNLFLEEVKEMDITKNKDDKADKKKPSKKSSSMKYISIAIQYRYSDNESGRFRVEFPTMTTSGINHNEEYDAEDGSHKYQVSSEPLSSSYIKFFDNFRSRVLELLAPYLSKTDPKFSKILADAIDTDDIKVNNMKIFKPLYRAPKKSPTKFRLYFKVKPYTTFHKPAYEKGKRTTQLIEQSALREKGKVRLSLKLKPVWQPVYVYIANNKSIVHELYQGLVLGAEKSQIESIQTDSINDIGDDYNDDDLTRTLAEMENLDVDDDEDSEEESEEEAPKVSKVKKTSKIKKMMDSEDEVEEEEEKPKKKPSKKKPVSDEDDE